MPAAAALKVGSRTHIADTLRKDLAKARRQWVEGAEDDGEREKRQRSDFLADANHRKEVAVFYSIRHAYGSALAGAGVPEKDIAASMHRASRTNTVRYPHAGDESRQRAIAALRGLDYTPPTPAKAGNRSGRRP